MTYFRTLFILILLCASSFGSFAQDDSPWWKKMFKKETVAEMDGRPKDQVEVKEVVPEPIAKDDSTINTPPSVERSPGQITVHTPSTLDSLNQLRVRDPLPTPGYRIQIFFGNLKAAKDLRNAYISKHPKDPCYLVQSSPNFAVRVGDFRSSLEASEYLHMIKSEYPSAYIVPDQISFPDLGN